MTRKQYLQNTKSEKSLLHKHDPVTFEQALYSSQGEYVDGLEMRNRFEDYFPCYRIGEEEHKYTQFADLDD